MFVSSIITSLPSSSLLKKCKYSKKDYLWVPIFTYPMESNVTALLKKGDRKTFEDLYLKEADKLLFYICGYIRDRAAAEDLLQETFMSLWMHKENLDVSYPLQPYLYSIAKNKCINALKKSCSEKSAKDTLKVREMQANLRALQDSSADIIIKFQLEEELGKVFRETPKEFLDTFLDSRVRGFTYETISEKRGISVKVVEYHITQVLKSLRKRLREFYQ